MGWNNIFPSSFCLFISSIIKFAVIKSYFVSVMKWEFRFVFMHLWIRKRTHKKIQFGIWILKLRLFLNDGFKSIYTKKRKWMYCKILSSIRLFPYSALIYSHKFSLNFQWNNFQTELLIISKLLQRRQVSYHWNVKCNFFASIKMMMTMEKDLNMYLIPEGWLSWVEM